MEPDFLNPGQIKRYTAGNKIYTYQCIGVDTIPNDIIRATYGLIDEAIKNSSVMRWYSNSTETIAAKSRAILAQFLNASTDTDAANIALDLAIEMHSSKQVR